MSRAALLKMRHDGLHPIKSRLRIDGHHFVEVLVRDLEDALADATPGVVDPDVDVPEGFDGPIPQLLDVRATPDIGDDGDRFGSGLGRYVSEFFFATGREGQTVTL